MRLARQGQRGFRGSLSSIMTRRTSIGNLRNPIPLTCLSFNLLLKDWNKCSVNGISRGYPTQPFRVI